MTTATGAPDAIELAKEFGMKGWVAERENIQREEAERTRLKALGYKITTIKELDRRLHIRHIAWCKFRASYGAAFAISAVVALIGGLLGVCHNPAIGASLGFTSGMVSCFILDDEFRDIIDHSYRQTTPLELWTDGIPYAALLAVKKAKEDGLEHFYVHYAGSDPILTGQDNKGGPIVELASW